MDLTRTYGCFEGDLPQQRKDAELFLEKFADDQAVSPPPGLKQRLLANFGFEGEDLELANLPVINNYSNYLSWLKVVRPLMPQKPVDTIFMTEFRRDNYWVQNLVISKVNVPEEIHETYAESFFILEGRCACTVDGKVFELSPGDFLPVPLWVPHDVQLLSPEVIAIVQYQLF